MTTDAALAFLIGALAGAGAALLLESGREDEMDRILRRLRQRGVRAHRAPRRFERELRTALEYARRVQSRD